MTTDKQYYVYIITNTQPGKIFMMNYLYKFIADSFDV